MTTMASRLSRWRGRGEPRYFKVGDFLMLLAINKYAYFKLRKSPMTLAWDIFVESQPSLFHGHKKYIHLTTISNKYS